MSVKTTIVITHGTEALQTIKDKLQRPTSKAKDQAIRVRNFFDAAAMGGRRASFTVGVDGGTSVKASGTIAFSGPGSANDTVLINGVTFTAVASGATGNQWNVGASATLSAANLAAAINASASALVSGQVSASAATGTLTITSLFNSVAGNAVTTAKGTDAGSVMTVSGARLTGGTNPPAATSYALT